MGYIKSLNYLRSEFVKAQKDHQAKVKHLIRKRDEIDHSFKDRSIEVEVLQEALRKKKKTSMELKAALDSEEKWRKRVEVKTAKLKEHISTQISEAATQAIEKFKISSKMRDLNVKFG